MENTSKTEFDFEALPIKIEFVGKVNDKEWPHYLWNATLGHKNGFFTVPYKTGLGLVVKPARKLPAYMTQPEPKPAKPTNKDLMYSLLLDASCADDFCSNMGYSNDSIENIPNLLRICRTASQGIHTRTNGSDARSVGGLLA